jgi:hypothetical protein
MISRRSWSGSAEKPKTKSDTEPPPSLTLSPPWNQERDKFLARAKELVGLREAQDLVQQLSTQDLFFSREERDDIAYKLKLRVYLRNETGVDIQVIKPTWSAAPDEVQVRPNLWSSVQVERGAGWRHNEWQGEVPEAVVRQSQTFRVWVGLNSSVPDDEFRQRHENLKVGTLRLPVRIIGFDVEFEKKI